MIESVLIHVNREKFKHDLFALIEQKIIFSRIAPWNFRCSAYERQWKCGSK
jgi:hypothetical protein